MRNVFSIRTALAIVGLALCALALVQACAPTVGRRQSQAMARSGRVSVSSLELRARVNDLADRFMSRIEETADRIAAETSDRGVHRRALAFKIDAVPTVYTAAYRADPLAAAMDMWALAFQIRRYFDVGPGRDIFGLQQPVALELSRELLASADAVLQGIAIRPEDYQRARAVLDDWTKTHVIEHAISSRSSYATVVASMRTEERDAFVVVGAVADTIENVSDRLNTYAAQLPKLARWQAELLMLDLGGAHDLESALGDIQQVGAVARRGNDLLGDVPGLVNTAIGPLRDLTADERRAVIDALNTQRMLSFEFATNLQRHTLAFASSERLAVVAAVREERLATLAALRDERVAIAAALEVARVETLKEVDAIRIRTVEASVVGLEETFDYALWKVAALLVFLMALATVFAVVGYRLTVGRARLGA